MRTQISVGLFIGWRTVTDSGGDAKNILTTTGGFSLAVKPVGRLAGNNFEKHAPRFADVSHTWRGGSWATIAGFSTTWHRTGSLGQFSKLTFSDSATNGLYGFSNSVGIDQ
jgi:hypothetical protein